MLKVIQRKTNSLTIYKDNPRDHSPLIAKLAEGIKTYGFNVPILIKSDGLIIDGAGRWKAAKILGLDTVPAIVVDHLSEEQVKAFRISVNQLSSLADWDIDKLESEISALAKTLNVDSIASLTAFDESVIKDLITTQQPVIQQEDTDYQNVFQLSNDVLFPTGGRWQLPKILNEPLYKGDAPVTWCGPSFSQESNRYLYIYSADSPLGLDWEKAIIGFYTADSKLEKVWTDTAGIVKRFIDKNIAGAITPDFSVFGSWPFPLKLYNMYRNLYIGRYMQEAGIPIVLNISATFDEIEYLLEMFPANAPIACQVQANYTKSELLQERNMIEAILAFKPSSLWFYGSPKSVLSLGIEPSDTIKIIPSRMSIRRDKVGF